MPLMDTKLQGAGRSGFSTTIHRKVKPVAIHHKCCEGSARHLADEQALQGDAGLAALVEGAKCDLGDDGVKLSV